MPFDGIHLTPVVRVRLHGKLKRFGGPIHKLGVGTAAEAVHALTVTQPGFRQAFAQGEYRLVRGTLKDGFDLEPISLHLKLRPGSELHIIPAPKGGSGSGSGGGKGGGKAILGAVIMVAAIAMAIPTGGVSTMAALGAAMGASTGVLGITYGAVFLMGASMFLGGISQMLSPQPKTPTRVNANDDRSFLLSGTSNVAEQGSPVPLIYGRVRVGSVVGSVGYSAEEYNPAPAVAADGTTDPTTDSAETPGYYEATAVDPLVGEGGGGGGGGGAKGGGGGGRSAKETPNNLRSRAVVRIIDVLGEGPIKGLVDGAKSIFFNNTPLQASDDTWNFKGVTWEVRTGEPDQAHVAGYPSAEQSVPVNQQVVKATPLIRTITSTTASALRVTIRLPALYTMDVETGDLGLGANVTFKFDVRPIGGAWKEVVTELITGGKCTSPYERSYRFNLPSSGSNSWDVRMTRTSDDSTISSDASDTWWAAYDVITDHKLIYPNTAYVALTIDSEAFGSQLPVRSYEVDGIECVLPLNYDPVAHTWATTGPGTSGGSWDGASVQVAWTNNPAMILYDLLSNTRYGLGLTAAQLAITKWDLYQIAQYCDQTVPDGYGGTEFRYALNAVMMDQEDAYRALQKFVATFRGMYFWANGSVAVTADMPAASVKLLTQANVLGGEFVYENTSAVSRHNAVRVAYRSPADSWAGAVEMIEDYAVQGLPGQRVADIVGFGVTSRGLANRLGRWLLDTENRTPETVTFAVSVDNMDIRPGDVVAIADSSYAGIRMGGRLLAGSTATVLRLDAVFTPEVGQTYSISAMLPDGQPGEAAVSSWGLSGGFTTVTVPALAAAPQTGAVFLITSSNLAPRQWRIAGMAEAERAEFNVVAVQYDPNKFSRVEAGVDLPSAPFSVLQNRLTEPLPRIGERAYAAVTSGGSATLTGVETTGLEAGMPVAPREPYPVGTYILSVTPGTGTVVLSANRTGSGAYTGDVVFHVISARSYLTGVGNTTIVRTTVSWFQPTDVRIDRVDVRVYTADTLFGFYSSAGQSVDIDNMPPGTYRFGVRAVGRDGRSGDWVDSRTETVTGTSLTPSVVSGLFCVGGTRRIEVKWNGVANRDLKYYEVWRKIAPTASGADPTVVAGAAFLRNAGGTSTVDSDSTVLLPNTAAHYWVRAVSTTDVPGPWAGPSSASTTLMVTDDLANAVINAAKFASSVKPVLVIADTTVGGTNGDYAVSTADGKLYKRVAGVWTNVVNTGDITGQITSSQIALLAVGTAQLANGAVVAAKIEDGAVAAAKIATGAVTLIKSGTGTAVNYVWNPCAAISLDGWATVGAAGTLTVAATGAPTWSLNGLGSLVYTPTAATWTTGTFGELKWRPNGSGNVGIPVNAGDRLWVQAQVIAKGGLQARFVCYWYDVNNTILATGNLAIYSGGPLNSAATSGNSLSDYTLMTGITSVAPANATRLDVGIRMANESGSTIDNVATGARLVITRVGVGPMPNATATEIPPWAPGAATELPGGMVRAGSLTNAQIADLNAIKITGQLTDAQVAALAATKITGLLTNAQIADLAATKISGTLTNTQIADLAAIKITGQLTNAQVADLAATKITGTLTSAQISDLAASKISGQLTSTQIADLAAIKITGQLTNAQVADLAATKITGQLTDAQVAALAATKITGLLTSAQIADLAATKITGLLTNAQIADLAATKISGTLTSAQIADLAAIKITGQLTNAQVADLAATKITGQLTDAQVAALAATKITGQLTTAQLADLSITSAKVSDAAIIASKLASAAVTSAALGTALPSNWIWNPCGAVSTDGWVTAAASVTASLLVAATADTTWSLSGQGSLVVKPTADLTTGAFIDLMWRPSGVANNRSFPVRAGDKLAIQLECIAKNGAGARLVVYWYDVAHVATLAHFGPTQAATGVADGNILSNYTRMTHITGVAPAGTVRAEVRIRLVNDTGATILLASNPFLVVTRWGVGSAPANATVVPEWVPGAATELPGGMVRAGSLTNAQIADLAAIKISGQLTNAQVADLAATKITGTLTNAQIADLAATKITGQLTNAQVADLAATKITGQLTNAQVADLAATKITGTLTNSQIADLAATKISGTLTNAQIADLAATKISGTLTGAQIADLAISGPKLAAGAVTAAKITAGTITATEMAANSITTTQLAAGAVTAAKITAGTITATEIAGSTITGAKIAAETIQAANIQAGTITATELGANSVTAVKIASGSIETAKLAAGAVTANEIAASTITGAKIAAGTIAAANIVTGTITATEIGANAITAVKIASGAVETAKLAAGAVTANTIATDAVTAVKILAGAIETAKLAAGSITAAKLAIGLPSNVIWNACPGLTTDGWTSPSLTGGGSSPALTPVLGSSYDPSWVLAGQAGMAVSATAMLNSAYLQTLWRPDSPVSSIVCVPGDVVEFQVRANGPVGFTSIAFINWRDAAGTGIGNGGYTTVANTGPADGRTLSNYNLIWQKATAPANTASADLVLRVQNTSGITSDGFSVFTRAAIGLGVNASQTEPQPWAPGGVSTITGGVIKTNSILARSIAANTITAAEIAAGTITAAQMAANSITTTQLAAGAVTAAKITAGTITATELGANSVTAVKIASGSIETAKLAAGAVTANEIAGATITGAKIAAGTIAAANIVTGTITATQIAGATITGEKIAAATIAAANIVAGTITATEIAGSTITGAKIAAGTIQAANIAAGTITATEIGANAITAVKIAAGAIETAKLAAGAVTANEIAGATITGAKIAAGTIAAANIVTGTITATQIAGATITGEKIAAATIQAANIVTGTITATQIAGATITGEKIAAATIVGANIQAGTIAASLLVLADTSNAYPDFDVRDAGYYSGAAFTIGGTATGSLGANEILIGNDAVTRIVYSSWFQLEVSAEYRVSGVAYPGIAGSTTAQLDIELGTLNALGVISSSRVLTVRAAHSVNDPTRANLDIVTSSTERRARFVMTKNNVAGSSGRFGGFLVRRRAAGSLIVDGAITAAKITASTITANEIAGSTITGAKIAAGTIAAANIVSGTITATQIAGATITGEKIAAGTIEAANIVTGTITATEIAGATITGAKIAAGTIQAANIQAGTITATEIAGATITGAKIAAGTIQAANIQAGTITATEIAGATITGAKIAATTIAAGNIAAGAITGAKLGIGLPSNVIWNACPGLTVDGWTAVAASGTSVNRQMLPVVGSSFDPTFVLAGTPGMVLRADSLNTGVYLQTTWQPDNPASSFACVPGDVVEIQALVLAPVGFNVIIYCRYRNAAGSEIGTGSYTVHAGTGPANGSERASYTRVGGRSTAPANTVGCVLVIRVQNGTGATAANGYGVVTQLSIGLTQASATELSPWAPGGVTNISGGVIRTGSLEANRIIANSITATQIGVGALTSATIAANAITASKLFLGDTSNAYPDFECGDASFYAGVVFTLTANAVETMGRNRITLAADASTRVLASAWFAIEAVADYAASGVAYTSAGTTTARLQIELASLDAAGAIASVRLVDVIPATASTSTARVVVNVLTAATERRARFVMTKSNSAVSSVNFGGFLVRRRATGALIVDGAITAAKIAANTITATQIAADTITAGQIAAGAIGASEIAANIITSSHLATSTLITVNAQMGTAVVNTAQIVDSAITTAKIGSAQITSAKIGNLQVTSAQIDNLTVGTNKIAYNSATRIAETGSFTGVTYPGGTAPTGGQNACHHSITLQVEHNGTVIIFVKAVLKVTATADSGASNNAGEGGSGE